MERGFRGIPPAFAWRSSGCRTFERFLPALAHVVRVSSYALRPRQESDAEADFRRAAPAAVSR